VAHLAIGLHQLTRDSEGRINGLWGVVLSSPLNHYAGSARFVDGCTVEPIDGRALQQIVAFFGPSIVAASSDLGEVISDDAEGARALLAERFGVNIHLQFAALCPRAGAPKDAVAAAPLSVATAPSIAPPPKKGGRK
jgi:hypothetical protein